MARRWRLQTARFRDQRAAERALWDATGTVFEAFCRYVWAHCGMPGEWAGLASPSAAEPYSWLPGEQAEFDRAVQWFMDSMVGKARDPEAFADPSTALIDVHNPIYDGKPILPGQLRTSYELGVNRAVQVVGDNAPRLLGPRNAEAQREFLTLAFRRLSDGARLKLGDVLNGTPKTGQSVRDMLLSAMNEGQGALKTARQLRTRFREIDGYDWQRLARTETSFAMNAGTQAEYLERGYRIPATETGAMIDLGPFHPNCVCGTTILVELGYIVPDVAATACQVCQAARIRAEMVVAQRVGVERIEITPVPAPQPRVSRRPVPRDTGAPTEPVSVGPPAYPPCGARELRKALLAEQDDLIEAGARRPTNAELDVVAQHFETTFSSEMREIARREIEDFDLRIRVTEPGSGLLSKCEGKRVLLSADDLTPDGYAGVTKHELTHALISRRMMKANGYADSMMKQVREANVRVPVHCNNKLYGNKSGRPLQQADELIAILHGEYRPGDTPEQHAARILQSHTGMQCERTLDVATGEYGDCQTWTMDEAHAATRLWAEWVAKTLVH